MMIGTIARIITAARMFCGPISMPSTITLENVVLLGSSAFTIARAVTGWWSGDGSPAWVLVGALVAAAASGVLCVVGLLRVGGDAIEGYLWFRRAVIVSLLVTQFFLFRLSQWDASWGLLVDLLVLGLVAAELDALRRRADGEG